MRHNHEKHHKGHEMHEGHEMKPTSQISWREKFKASMTMVMGMEHTGLAGAEMAKVMEKDIRRKFFFALILSIPIIAYSPLGEKLLGFGLPTPVSLPWLLFILTTPVFFYSGWIFLYSTYASLARRTLNMAVLIAVGITAAYGFSVVLTFLGNEDDRKAESVLFITQDRSAETMEIKSRRGTSDAL